MIEYFFALFIIVFKEFCFFYLFKIKSKLTKSLCMCYVGLHFALTYGTILTLSWWYYLPRVNLFTHANCESYHYTLDCMCFTGTSDASTASYSNICAETLGGMSVTQLCAEVLQLFLWLGKWKVFRKKTENRTKECLNTNFNLNISAPT